MVSGPRNAGIYGLVGGRPDVSHRTSTMEHRAVFLTLFLTIILGLIASSSGDDVKHKKVIIKVPKKIKHIHHHHVKKVHIWKHKPKPIHSIHVVEEEEPIGKDWKGFFEDKKQPFAHWKDEKHFHEGEDEKEGDEYEEDGHEDYYEEHQKSGSNYRPVVWKGDKNTKKQRAYGNEKTKSLRGIPRAVRSGKGDRTKRQKHAPRVPYYDDQFYDEPRHNTKPNTRKPTSSRGKYKKTEKRSKPKPHRPREPESPDFRDYEYSEYEDFNRGRPVWPERKEHISWHIRDDTTDGQNLSEDPKYINNDYQSEYKGEISLVNEPFPDIPVVPPPNLAPTFSKKVKKIPHSLPLKAIFLPNLEPEKSLYPDLEDEDIYKSPTNLHQQNPYLLPSDLFKSPKTLKQENPYLISSDIFKSQKNLKQENPYSVSSNTFKSQKNLKQEHPYLVSADAFNSQKTLKQVHPYMVSSDVFKAQRNLKQENPYSVLSDVFKPQKNLKQEHPYLVSSDVFKAQRNLKQENPYSVPSDAFKPQKNLKVPVSSPLASDGFRTHYEEGGGVFSGYSSHVGHNAEGDAASFQSVTFGEKKKTHL